MIELFERLIGDTNFWVMLSTVLCFAFIAIKSRHSVADGLATRTDAIRQRLEEAESLRKEAEAVLLAAQDKADKAAEEAEFIVTNAKTRAEQMRQEMEASTRNMIEREELKAKNRIARLEEETIRDIKDRIITLAVNQAQQSVANDSAIRPSIDASLAVMKTALKK